MPTQPNVSVIVPVHGTAWSLRQCLDSLVGQSLRDIEIIVVNDASPDDAGSIIDEYAQRDSRVRVMTNAVNCNLFESRLRGFEAAEGNFIASCDSDDVMPPTALECLYAAAQQEGADIVHGRTRERDGRRSGAVFLNAEPFRVATGGQFVAAMFGNIRGWNVWGKLFRKALVLSCINVFPRDTGWFQAEDIAYCTVFGLAAARYVGIDDFVYEYRFSDFQSIRDEALREKRIRDQLQILAFLGKILENAPSAHGLEQPFSAMAQHVMAAALRTVPVESRKQFSDDIAQIGLGAMKRPGRLSWRYHYDWIRKNGLREYMLRIKILCANAYRVGGRNAFKRLVESDS